jgi:hypothetical protein
MTGSATRGATGRRNGGPRGARGTYCRREVLSPSLLTVAVAVVALAAPAATGPRSAPARPPVARVSPRLPAGWRLVKRDLAVSSDQPQRLAAATFRVRPRRSGGCVDSTLDPGRGRLDDACLPWAGAVQTPPGDAFVYVVERLGTSRRALHASARPARFQYAAARIGATCSGVGTAVAFAFVDHGRVYQAMLLIDTRATARTRAAALTLLDGMRLGRTRADAI